MSEQKDQSQSKITTFTPLSKIKSVQIVDGKRLEITFEDKDSKVISVDVHDAEGTIVDDEAWVFEELQCVYWNTIKDYRGTVGKKYAWNAYNPSTNQKAKTGYHQYHICYNGWILTPEDDIKRLYALRDFQLDWGKACMPDVRKRDFVVMVTNSNVSDHFFTDWTMACIPFDARMV
jgi:hypothetical protein